VRKRLISSLVGLVVIAGLLGGTATAGGTAPAGVAQGQGCIDPNYCPQEPLQPTNQQLKKKCIKKAKKKFPNDAVKKKAAIKKCKKKYP
jgi:hypothetical protein